MISLAELNWVPLFVRGHSESLAVCGLILLEPVIFRASDELLLFEETTISFMLQ